MRVTPKTEAQIAEEGLFIKGTYDFEVFKAEEKISKSGNDMIAVTLKVYNEEGGHTLVNDYLLESIAYKLRHFCAAIGMLPQYEAGHLQAEEMVNRSGKVKIDVDARNPDYPPKNVAKDYVPAVDGAPAAAPRPASRQPAMAGTADDPFDEIPF